MHNLLYRLSELTLNPVDTKDDGVKMSTTNRNKYVQFFSSQNDSNRHDSSFTPTQTIVTLSKLFTPPAMLQCLKFIYTGTIDKECSNLKVCKSTKYLLIRRSGR